MCDEKTKKEILEQIHKHTNWGRKLFPTDVYLRRKFGFSKECFDELIRERYIVSIKDGWNTHILFIATKGKRLLFGDEDEV